MKIPAVGKYVVYVDAAGVEHDALVSGVNGLHEGVLDLVFVSAGEVETRYGVVHISDESKQENNPELPAYHLNVWKGRYEDHLAPPADHANFDHPFRPAPKDDVGHRVAIARPETEKQAGDYQKFLESVAEEAAKSEPAADERIAPDDKGEATPVVIDPIASDSLSTEEGV